MPGSGFGFGYGPRVKASAASFDAATLAYISALSVAPSGSRKRSIDRLVKSLKSGTVWDNLDWLELLSAHDAQAGLVNLVNPAQASVAVNSPTFTVDRGYTGDGVSSYLNTNWNPSSASGRKFLQNDAHMGAWIGTDVNSNAQYDLGCTYSNVNGRLGSTVYGGSPNSTAFSQSTGGNTSVGHSGWVRTGASAGSYYKNGVAGTAFATASTAPHNAPFLILANNNSTTGLITPASYSTRRVQAVHWGRQLSAAQELALYNALAQYMTDIGA